MSTAPRVWFITDAFSGCARSLAEEAVRRGDNVVATAPDPGTLDSLASLAPQSVEVVRLDVSQTAQIPPAIDAALRRFGRIDVLVGYAGFSVVGALEATREGPLRATMEALFNPVKAAVAIAEAVAEGEPNLGASLGAGAARSVRDKLAQLGAREMVASVTGF